MSDWRKRKLIATFRGVPFFVDGSEQQGGRRTVPHEVPFSEDPPYVEDTGKQGPKFSVDGYVIGTEYVAARDLLADALDKPGPGELVHPYFGTRRVAVNGYRVRETRLDGGVAAFSIEFQETVPGPVEPEAATDPTSAATFAAAEVTGAARPLFAAQFKAVSGFLDSAISQVKTLSSTLQDVAATVDATEDAVTDVRRQLVTLAETAADLVRAPFDLADGVISSITSTGEALAGQLAFAVRPSGLMLQVYDALAGLAGPVGTTPARVQEQANFAALKNLGQRVALSQAAALLVGEKFDSYDAALLARSAVLDRIDAHLESATDDVFSVLQALRSALVLAVPGEAQDLPRLLTYTVPATVCSLVLAHRLYGDVDLEADLLARNGISNPGFIFGGSELEVLGRG